MNSERIRIRQREAFMRSLRPGHVSGCVTCRHPIVLLDPVDKEWEHQPPRPDCTRLVASPFSFLGWTTQGLAAFDQFLPLEAHTKVVVGSDGWWSYTVADGWQLTPRGGVPLNADTTGTEWWLRD